jgi:conjugative transfer signal peptidase TraF
MAAAFAVAGFRINITKSLPRGLYLIVDEPIQKGTVVLVCPPDNPVIETGRERGYLGYSADCPGRYQHLIKRVSGTPGAVISKSIEGDLMIGGQVIPGSVALAADANGRPLTAYFQAPVMLKAEQFLIMGDTANSFDGRYFGPVDRKAIRAVMRPVFTF